MPKPVETVLILGGTAEAAALASQLMADHPHWRIITSLAGRTKEPKPVAGEIRIGGFGGVDGLAAFLKAEHVTRLIDATHPFALQISKNAKTAAALAGVPFDSRERKPWKKEPGDDWIEVATIEEAVVAIPSDARVLLAIGSQHIAPFAARADAHFLVRMVDAPLGPLEFPDSELALGLPGSVEEECALLRAHRITHIVCRNSGGEKSYTKIEAARIMSLAVIMVSLPSSS